MKLCTSTHIPPIGSPIKEGKGDTGEGGDGERKEAWTVVSTRYNGAEDQKQQGPLRRLRFVLNVKISEQQSQ